MRRDAPVLNNSTAIHKGTNIFCTFLLSVPLIDGVELGFQKGYIQLGLQPDKLLCTMSYYQELNVVRCAMLVSMIMG